METTITGSCSKCHKVWTLDTGAGICEWCGKQASCFSGASPRVIKSRPLKQRQALTDKGYDQLADDWLTYYKVASRFAHKAKVQDTEDLLHDIITTLADIARGNRHKPLTGASMYRIASHKVADYWRTQYKLTNGLDCGSCSQAQRKECKEHELHTQCPKAIKLESLSKPVTDNDGNLTELGELIADDTGIDLDAWVSDSTWEIGYPSRLVNIAYKLKAGTPLTNYDRLYLCRYRKREQKRLFE